jgi:hypothetical protein
MNWYKMAQSDMFFTQNDIMSISPNNCPCCGGNKIKGWASDEWHKCRDTLNCPLSNIGGYFSDEVFRVEIDELGVFDLGNESHVEKLREWANSYKREAGAPNIQIGDIGILINSQHFWTNGEKIKIVEENGDDKFTAMSVEPKREGLYFLDPGNIANFQDEWLENPDSLVGMTVIVQGQATLHPQNRQDILTDGKKVKISNYLADSNQWAAYTQDLEMYNYFEIGSSNFKKTG